MCPDRNPAQGGRSSLPVPGEELQPPTAVVLARLLYVTGVALCLVSLPMSSTYFGIDQARPVPTLLEIAVYTFLAAFVFPWVLLLIWFCVAVLACAFSVFRGCGAKGLMLMPLLAAPLLLPWLGVAFDARNWPSRAYPPVYGGVIFAIGCSLMFLSTLPGLYYWVKFRLSRRNRGT